MSLRDARYKDKQLARAVEWQGIMAKPSGGRRLESGAKLSATCRGPGQDKGDRPVGRVADEKKTEDSGVGQKE